jgi:3-hydroxyisobutyrate dehydrogenase-like beta-hydroxyacid dehydrogenase
MSRALSTSGGAAEEGTLLSLMGAEAADVERATVIALGYGQGAEHMGALGAGQLAKVNNYLHWVHVATNVEALALAKKCGIDAERMRDVLMKSPGNNGSLGDLGHYGLTWHEKDMDLLLDMAQTAGLMMPIAGEADQIMKSITKKDTNELLFEDQCATSGSRCMPWATSWVSRGPRNGWGVPRMACPTRRHARPGCR